MTTWLIKQITLNTNQHFASGHTSLNQTKLEWTEHLLGEECLFTPGLIKILISFHVKCYIHLCYIWISHLSSKSLKTQTAWCGGDNSVGKFLANVLPQGWQVSRSTLVERTLISAQHWQTEYIYSSVSWACFVPVQLVQLCFTPSSH